MSSTASLMLWPLPHIIVGVREAAMASHHVVNGRWRVKVVTVDPDAVRFTVAEAPVFADCQGCIFFDQPSEVCERANVIAQGNGLIACDDPLPNGRSGIYVLDRTDPRQIQMELEK